MIDAEDTYSWKARRAAWRKDWPFVEGYTEGASITQRLQEEKEIPLPFPMYTVVISVYTSYGIEFKDLEYLKAVWCEANVFITTVAPEMADEVRQSWLETAYLYYRIEKNIELNPADFGFTE